MVRRELIRILLWLWHVLEIGIAFTGSRRRGILRKRDGSFKEIVHSILYVGIRGHLTLECAKLCNFVPRVLQRLLLFFSTN